MSCEELFIVCILQDIYFIFIRSYFMKEVEKNEIKCLSDCFDVICYQQVGFFLVEFVDKYVELEKEKEMLEVEIICLCEVYSQKLSKEVQKLMNLLFCCVIIKKEQVDMGKLKKSVCGLIVVYLMMVLGWEMGFKEMIGFVKSEF